ncbi:DUF4294 domain-containing protein [Daejeonella sp.]|jgi:hypothetical protein|uniref:DUF4294 domain-containing protein n=1 Tax=Daejeonella sp. TaxID=2805397 RepID=UPI003783B2B8
MKILRLLVIILVVLMSKLASAQYKNDPTIKGLADTIRVSTTNINNELIPWVVIPEIVIIDTRIFKSPEEKAKFNRLKYNVLKVLPYAMYARMKYAALQSQLSLVKGKKEKRVLIKAFESEIKDMFNREIKNLTITQGGILIKLIDRETGTSSYDLLKDMKGGITAFFYQSVARVFGNNLKNTYDPQEDRDIEAIIQSSGYYSYSYL